MRITTFGPSSARHAPMGSQRPSDASSRAWFPVAPSALQISLIAENSFSSHCPRRGRAGTTPGGKSSAPGQPIRQSHELMAGFGARAPPGPVTGRREPHGNTAATPQFQGIGQAILRWTSQSSRWGADRRPKSLATSSPHRYGFSLSTYSSHGARGLLRCFRTCQAHRLSLY